MFRTQDELYSSLIERMSDNGAGVFDRHLVQTLAKLSEQGLRLVVSKPGDEPNIGASKIGGAPDLPPEFDWPIRPRDPEEAERCRKAALTPDDKLRWMKPEQRQRFRAKNAALSEYYDRPAKLPFLAQLNFAQLNPHKEFEELPDTGMLYLFYEIETQPWGYEPSHASGSSVSWCDFPTDLLERTHMDDPSLTNELSNFVIAPRALSGFPIVYPIHSEEDEVRALALSFDQEDEYAEWCSDQQEYPDHRLLGHPNIIQSEMKSECAMVAAGYNCGNGVPHRNSESAKLLKSTKQWRLLMQVDSEDDIMWGDSGMLYLWIREDDLLARRFEKVIVILQCS